MGSLFKSPKVPDPPPMPDYDEVAKEVEEEQKKATRRFTGKGRAATILTSPLGITDELGKTLLGS